MAKKRRRKTGKDFHVKDLSSYPEEVKRFKALAKKLLSTPAGVEKVLREFDKRQKKRWAKYTFK